MEKSIGFNRFVYKAFKYFFKTTNALLYYFITLMIPKKKNLWVFGSWKGRNYSDNSKSLFEYVSKSHPNIKAVWIAKNEEVYNQVKALGYDVVLYPSLNAKWIIARAQVNIQTESNEDTGKYRVGGSTLIQLFHGYGAIKETPLFAGMSKWKKKIVKIYADDHSKSYWMVPSEYCVDRYPFLCECNKKKMYVTGQPRIDLLLSQVTVPFFEDFKKEHKNAKLIAYTPTHRNYGQDGSNGIQTRDWVKLNSFLENNDYFFFFKPHPLELKNYLDFPESYSRIILVTNTILPNDVYEYLHYFDMLISDYSSISSDYLVLNRPIIHFMYDVDTFVTDKANINALDKFAAGPICKTINDLVYAIGECLNNDKYEEKRKKAAFCALRYIDTNNSKRVYDTIVNKILKQH